MPRLAAAIDHHLGQLLGALPRGARVLDAGCGRQPFRAVIEGRGLAYASVDAVQNPEGTVDFVAALDAPVGPDLLAAGPFDLILCTEVLEHVADWTIAFSNLAQLVAPGGAVLVTCPHFYPLHEVPYDFWRPTPYAIRHHAHAHGFAVETEVQLGDNWDVLGTFLAEAWAYPRSPRLVDRALAWLVRHALRATFAAIARGGIPRRVELRGLHYLSNVAVLRRLTP